MKVELLGVSKHFGKVTALRDVDLALESGRSIALVGPNGSGKSTLVRVVLGLLRHHGSVRLDGQPAAVVRHGLANDIAYVPQIAPRARVPVGELVRAVCRLRQVSPRAVAGSAARLELDLDTVIERPLDALSGGTKQKVMLALALVRRPRLLVMDEPTASLDPATRARFFDMVTSHTEGATVLLSSHRIEEIRHLVDDVVVLGEGQVRRFERAAKYLSRQASSVIELRVREGADGPWLQSLDFVPRGEGWWTRPTAGHDKMDVLGRIAAHQPDIEDVMVRDLSHVTVEQGDAGA